MTPGSLSEVMADVPAQFSDLEYSAKRKQARRDRFLGEIDATTPWTALVEAIVPHDPKGSAAVPRSD